MDPLTPIEVRVLGSLIEKDLTTPEYYPLTLNSLVLACNQSSNRDPVVSFEESAVARAIETLREKKLAYLHGGGSGRVPRYGHRLPEVFPMDRGEVALLCVLLLRGPQTVGELKGRTARMHEFASLAETEAALTLLSERTNPPLVQRLPREAGNKEPRYVHLLAPPPSPLASAEPAPSMAAPPPDDARMARLEQQISSLEQQVAKLQADFAEFRGQFE